MPKKINWNIELFKKEINKLNLEENIHIISNECSDLHTNLEFIHICENGESHHFIKTGNAFLRTPSCSVCSQKRKNKHMSEIMLKYTIEKVREIVKDLSNYEIELISNEYRSTTDTLLFRHKICGHTFYRSFIAFMSNPTCPRCVRLRVDKSRTKTLEQFKTEVNELNPNIELVDDSFISCSQNITFICHDCGTIFTKTGYNFLNAPSCPHCAKIAADNKKAISHDKFVGMIRKLVGDEYTVVTKYSRHYNSFKMRHNVCGHVFETTVKNFVYEGHRCPECAKKLKYEGALKSAKNKILKAKDNFHKKISEKFILLDGADYEEPYKSVKLKCCKCGETLLLTPNYLQKIDYKCPNCKKLEHGIVRYNGIASLNEKLIQNLLKDKNIPFKYQYSYCDCRDVNVLPFDFAILGEDNCVKCLIEYDGEQHFQPVDYFGGEEGFQIRKRHDQIKNDYCKSHNITLYRINYLQDTKTELFQILQKYNL